VAEQGIFYMQRAALGLFKLIVGLIEKNHQNFLLSFPKITVFAGKGNNGGDGILLAAELLKHDYKVKCYSTVDPSEYQGESALAYQLFLQAGGKIDVIHNDADILSVKHFLLKQVNGIWVDALLGIGSKGAAHGVCAKLIEVINSTKVQSKSLCVSVDIPSGIDVDSGEVFEPSINADYTVQMGFSKISSLFYPAKTKYGQIVFQELKYPLELVSRSSSVKIFSVDLSMVKSFIPERKITGSKFDHGVGMLLAGSYGMSGAAMLSGSAAVRSGLGLLHVFSYESVLPIIAANIWDAVLHPITENVKANIDYVKDFLTSRKIDALALGPGLSTNPKSISLVKNILELMTMIDSKPLILDADAINAFVGSTDLLKAYSGELLITPHAKEFSRLFQEDISEYAPYDKAKFLSETAQKYSLEILYKGAPTYVARSSGEVYIVPTGCSALAKAGSGDVLTGLILSFVAQGLELYQAGILAAYVHNLMGLLAVEKDSEYSVLASDLIKYVGMAIEILKQDDIKNPL
jgi:NAD(P)H-hydrate epimerase